MKVRYRLTPTVNRDKESKTIVRRREGIRRMNCKSGYFFTIYSLALGERQTIYKIGKLVKLFWKKGFLLFHKKLI